MSNKVIAPELQAGQSGPVTYFASSMVERN